jgi:hypothetical protein
MKIPSQEELETMKDARAASLIRRWLVGKKLTEPEKAEIAHIIPLDVLAKPPTEGQRQPLNTRKHAKYKNKLPEYAEIFGQTERTIKRWIRRGKELSDLPPLDDPSKMATWWRRSMDNQVPDYLLGFLTVPDPLASSGDIRSTEASTGNSGEGGSQAQPRDFSQVKSLDLQQNVEELRRSHAINTQLLNEALTAAEPNEQAISLRQRNYERSFELLRKAETSLIELRKATGDLIDKEKVRTELAQVFESLRLMRETMTDRIMIALEKMLPRKFQRVLRLLEKYLRPAIEKTRADEENIFRNVGMLEGPEDVEKMLAA